MGNKGQHVSRIKSRLEPKAAPHCGDLCGRQHTYVAITLYSAALPPRLPACAFTDVLSESLEAAAEHRRGCQGCGRPLCVAALRNVAEVHTYCGDLGAPLLMLSLS